MSTLKLSLACFDYDRMQPLMDGTVRPEGIDLTFIPMRMPESFWRMRHFQEFDISEMSLGAYVREVAAGTQPYIAIPVFPSRMFRHCSIYINASSGIAGPEDLVGKRIGIPEYSMTAAVWIKGILSDHHGVPVSSANYFTGGLIEPGRHEVKLDLPADIHVEPIPAGGTLSDMLASGEIDALYSADLPSTFHDGKGAVRRLFADYAITEREYFAKTRIFPIMHTMVIRNDVYESNRWIARSLTKACKDAQEIAYNNLKDIVALKTMLPWLPSHVEETLSAFGTEDYWPYGLPSNHDTLKTFLRYATEQGLVPDSLEPEDLFAPETLRESRT